VLFMPTRYPNGSRATSWRSPLSVGIDAYQRRRHVGGSLLRLRLIARLWGNAATQIRRRPAELHTPRGRVSGSSGPAQQATRRRADAQTAPRRSHERKPRSRDAEQVNRGVLRRFFRKRQRLLVCHSSCGLPETSR
jgi:hypothetical protein